MSKLYDLISKLSKSSPEAVNTLKSSNSSLMDYLYITTEVEKKYLELLEQNFSNKSIIFLCGSSGDGKSAIINRHYKKYKSNYEFHVDATHSFEPSQTSIEALNESFTKYKNSNKSLVVGINIGIMLNFIAEGSQEHSDIIDSFKLYDKKRTSSNNIFFINFEDYPKFKFENKQISSPFIESILNKITEQSEENPFYKAFLEDIENETTSVVHQNYKLLSDKSIQKSIINLLILVYLKYDQFVTARTLLDFIYTLIKGPKILINQLFEERSNPIINNIHKEDPILNRTFLLDKFILESSTNQTNNDLDTFIEDFNKACKKPILKNNEPFTLLRCFYLFKDCELSNNYHHIFKDSFEKSTKNIINFIELISSHQNYDKTVIKEFYEKLKNAIYIYVNKTAPTLTEKKLFTISAIENSIIATPLKIRENTDKIKEHQINTFNSFPLFITINGIEIKTIDITFNMYQLLLSINEGYRPNKHDRNTIIIFEELIQSINEIAILSEEISIIHDKTRIDFSYIEDDDIEVQKYER
ncbi:DNA phosphorothioation-dependent restriction protein DptF [Sulfurimonas sp. C5]|uniref:DNA phosphorothioation-dependent restriction protein DptF n=1 Tax=Sulfurimonas sp. C5 TaxID=3036947 RepID=UPI0024569FCA|nr:DNA phosphorothioation-dependent restriction protein DptF [Sulfurimonas sp. C5]MDH4943955.1 DNA phosphorothioation-dependent restriction protein DptF [Sulfurimonas sp. C5]